MALARDGLWSGARLVREVASSSTRRSSQIAELRSPELLLPAEEVADGSLLVREDERPQTWWPTGALPDWW
ncbi:hypothetical protein [Streptomyces hilarionis]|uniref:hypothetical protein n=1 Tax=Streptomyces hilarionis TaxID=2839954 RepID=UPI002119C01A|nr:hypothetical protein [Streptomyces hilarionis]MCQ9131310.1 hypothetical protein [Streptomyces hilarionis]